MAGLYIHIPFCNEKCTFCDFYSGNQLYLIDSYVEALCKEISIRSDYLDKEIIDTVYFGGGTPSLLSEAQLANIFRAIQIYLSLGSSSEITIECNPENITTEYVRQLERLGVNRVSLGVQFLSDDALSNFNRKHNKELIFRSLDIILNSSIENLSIDLIYAVQGIDDTFLLSSLNQLVRYDIKHVSAYNLTVGKNSKLYWRVKRGEYSESKEDVFISQYRIIKEFLKEHGFMQYEISNYAKPGFISRHNLAYWNQIPYLGVGVTAHSYNGSSRQWNGTNIKKYIRGLELKVPNLDFEIEYLDDFQLYNEYVILKLRTFQGLSFSYVRESFGDRISVHFEEAIQKLRSCGHFDVVGESVVPKESDLLIADFLAKELMI